MKQDSTDCLREILTNVHIWVVDAQGVLVKIELPTYSVSCRMQSKQIQGLHFLVDKEKNVFSYEKDGKEPILLGKYDAEKEKVALRADWREVYQPRLELYRTTEKPRSRVPGATATQ